MKWLTPMAVLLALVPMWVAVWRDTPPCRWYCHTCANQGIDTVRESHFVWLARRRSIRHEREAHGFSVYDNG